MTRIRFPELWDVAWLREQYLTQRKNTRQIAEELGCDYGYVAKALRRAGLARPRGTRFGGLAAARYWAKVDVRGKNECWPWKAFIAPGGHGRFMPPGKRGSQLAHVFGYELARGPLIAELIVHHTCFNSACQNPRHLEAMTTGEHSRLHRALDGIRPPRRGAA